MNLSACIGILELSILKLLHWCFFSVRTFSLFWTARHSPFQKTKRSCQKVEGCNSVGCIESWWLYEFTSWTQGVEGNRYACNGYWDTCKSKLKYREEKHGSCPCKGGVIEPCMACSSMEGPDTYWGVYKLQTSLWNWGEGEQLEMSSLESILTTTNFCRFCFVLFWFFCIWFFVLYSCFVNCRRLDVSKCLNFISKCTWTTQRINTTEHFLSLDPICNLFLIIVKQVCDRRV